MVSQVVSRSEKAVTRKSGIFARHETFHPRFGWLKKGFDQAAEDPGVFLREDAPVALGVGKNMVRSIRYWCRAFKVLAEDKPTSFGRQLLEDKGWDPFLEDPASLWLLHWNLLKDPCSATAWAFTFNDFHRAEFSPEDLERDLKQYCDREFSSSIADSSIKKDVTCILRMYANPITEKSRASEESIDCPFAQLSLIDNLTGTHSFIFRVGPKHSLPVDIIVAACLQYAESQTSQRRIAISDLAFCPGSPGMVFKLPENSIYGAVEAMVERYGEIHLADSAGLVQFSFEKDPSTLADDILKKYYSSRRK